MMRRILVCRTPSVITTTRIVWTTRNKSRCAGSDAENLKARPALSKPDDLVCLHKGTGSCGYRSIVHMGVSKEVHHPRKRDPLLQHSDLHRMRQLPILSDRRQMGHARSKVYNALVLELAAELEQWSIDEHNAVLMKRLLRDYGRSN